MKPLDFKKEAVKKIARNVWVQECIWANRSPGSDSPTTLKKLADKYTLTNIEEFVRAQFIMTQNHSFALKGPLNFRHLSGNTCEEVYRLWLSTRTTYFEELKYVISTQVVEWFAERDLCDETGTVFMRQMPTDPLAKYLVLSRRMRLGEKLTIDIYPLLWEETALDQWYKTVKVAAIQIMHWPTIMCFPQFKNNWGKHEQLIDTLNEMKQTVKEGVDSVF